MSDNTKYLAVAAFSVPTSKHVAETTLDGQRISLPTAANMLNRDTLGRRVSLSKWALRHGGRRGRRRERGWLGEVAAAAVVVVVLQVHR